MVALREVELSVYPMEALARPIGVIIDDTAPQIRERFYRSRDVVRTVESVASRVPEQLRGNWVDEVIRLFHIPPRKELRTARSCVWFILLSALYRVTGQIEKAEKLAQALSRNEFTSAVQAVQVSHTNTTTVIEASNTLDINPSIEIAAYGAIHDAAVQQARFSTNGVDIPNHLQVARFRTSNRLPPPFEAESTYLTTKRMETAGTYFNYFKFNTRWILGEELPFYPKQSAERFRDGLILQAAPELVISDLYTVAGKVAMTVASPSQALEICFGYPSAVKLDEARRLVGFRINNQGNPIEKGEIILSSPPSLPLNGRREEWHPLGGSVADIAAFGNLLEDYASLQEALYGTIFPQQPLRLSWATSLSSQEIPNRRRVL